MANKKVSRRALFTSVISLILCCAMLMGTTFAWFTDSVASTNNRIQSGTLDIALEVLQNDEWVDASSTDVKIFDYDKWEPGYTQVVQLRVANRGTLALKWQASLVTQNTLSKLAEAIDVYVISDDQNDTVSTRLAGLDRPGAVVNEYDGFKKFCLKDFINNLTAMTTGSMLPEQESYLGLVLQMRTDAGNEYQGLDLGGTFDLVISATQHTYEEDSFDANYDNPSEYGAMPIHGIGTGSLSNGQVAIEVRDMNNAGNAKVAYVTVPKAALADETKDVEVNVIPTTLDTNVEVQNDQAARSYNVEVTNIAENNEEWIKVELRVGMGLSGVKVFHKGVEITEPKPDYNPNEGVVTFYSKSFSPFTVVYDAVYVAPEQGDKENIPNADIRELTVPEQDMYIIPDIINGFSGGENIKIQPDTAFTFTANDTAETVANSAYKDWYVDYYVSVDNAVEEGLILVGCYGNWDGGAWYGFNVPTGSYDEPVGLLGSMSTTGVSNWTYADIVTGVQSFVCGAVDMDGNNTGTKMTVELRLIDPQDTTKMITVAEIPYTFQ